MANLYSQYASGIQFTAGTITGSALGTSGLNPIVDRLNSISSSDNYICGSLISGTNTTIYGKLFSSVVIGSITLSGLGAGTGSAAIGSILLDSLSNCLLIHTGNFVWGGSCSMFRNIKFSGTELGGGLTTANNVNYDNEAAVPGSTTFTSISSFQLPSGITMRWDDYSVSTGDNISSSVLYVIPLNLNTRITWFK